MKPAAAFAIILCGDFMTEIQKKIEELRKTLRYHSDRYYNDDSPEIEDYEYDMMMRELQELEEKYPEYDSPDSPTKRVGGSADNSFLYLRGELRKITSTAPPIAA